MTSFVCGRGVGQYRANVIGRLRKGVAMKKLRTLADVLRQAGFVRITGLFLIFYLLCSTAVWLSEPTTLTFGDGLWFSFETVSTIGFGDIPAETPVARAITVVLSVISIFYIAMLTGVAVNYCNTLIKLRQKDTMRALWTIWSIWKSSIATSLPIFRVACASIVDASAKTNVARHNRGQI